VVPSKTVLDRHPSGDMEIGLAIGTPVKICIANCGQTVTDRRIVTIESLYNIDFFPKIIPDM